jgi:cytochrome P450
VELSSRNTNLNRRYCLQRKRKRLYFGGASYESEGGASLTTPAAPGKPLAGLAPPPLKPASFLKTLRASRGNAFEVVPLRAYEQPVYLSQSFFGKVLMVNDPEGVRRVLLDNVANYPKNDLEIEFFSAMFGEGLLSAPHAKWRTHRKVMAPSFGTRTVESYAPAMVETTLAFVQRWDALPSTRK